MSNVRERWSSELGLVAGAIGSAVGLGNIWLFPMLVGQNGGAAFLIPYFIFTFSFVWTGLVIEFNTGRIAQQGPAGAYEELGMPFGKYIGLIPGFRPLVVLIFYASIAGWTLRYIGAPANEQFWAEPGAFFGTVNSGLQSAVFAVLALAIIGSIVYFGIEKGIEPATKLMIGLLFILLVLLGIRSVLLPGSLEGLRFYLVPDFSKLTTRVVLNAMAQAFFTASLAGAPMIVYGSYLSEKADTVSAAITTTFGNATIALLSGFAIFPAALAVGVEPNASGPGLLFISLPAIAQQLPGSTLIVTGFFLAAALAAISTGLSILEVPVDSLKYHFGLPRKVVTPILVLIVAVVAIPTAMSSELFDTLTTIVLYTGPLAALLAPLGLFWAYDGRQALEQINEGPGTELGDWFFYWGKYIYPAGILAAYAWDVLG
ncbi:MULTISPECIES: sodium-dependent transporter [Halostella]|uniref:sodium-dependent transporter n=1 Tax=Halostella TaxID=1843185 RepID=UPI0010802A80|nr:MULTISPECIES: sodium-dependent transporter [Halostella]